MAVVADSTELSNRGKAIEEIVDIGSYVDDDIATIVAIVIPISAARDMISIVSSLFSELLWRSLDYLAKLKVVNATKIPMKQTAEII